MKVASILPVADLQRTINNDYFMALAQFIEVDGEYTKFFQQRIVEGKFVILDNGAAEGCQPTIEELYPKIKILNPSELVLPDTIYNKEETLQKGEEAIFKLANEFPDSDFQLMAVPQGETFEEWVACMEEMLTWPIDTIGVSKFITPRYGPRARLRATLNIVASCLERGNTVKIHLLGCWDHPKEIGEIVQRFEGSEYYKTFLRGTDSAVPYVYTAMGETIVADSKRPEYHMDFLSTTKLTDELEGLLTLNIKAWEDYCNGRLR